MTQRLKGWSRGEATAATCGSALLSNRLYMPLLSIYIDNLLLSSIISVITFNIVLLLDQKPLET
jgi:hypothetical protein